MEDLKDGQRRFSWGKTFVFILIINVVILTALEGVARVGAYVYYDFNPYYLFFGTQSWKTEEGHSEKLDGYFKFPSNRKFIYGTPEPARINNHGFRGPDFDTDKAETTYRIICMGASSTFGFSNRDEGTYPAILQRLFRDRLSEWNVEVINTGVPHLNTDNIVAMLRGELLDYDADLLTLYTGYNDAVRPVDENAIQRAQRWLDTYSAAYAALRKGASNIGKVIHAGWTTHG